MRSLCPACLILVAALACAAVGLIPAAASAETTPACRAYRAGDAQGAAFGMLSFDELLAELAQADVVFLGEYHDDPATHKLQLEILSGLYDLREGNVALSMEQFERDVQPALDRYLGGLISEEEFLKESRPWPNYDPDYRRLIEFAKANQLRVVAANIPRPLASRIAKQGFDAAWASYTPEERPWVAESTTAPKDLYFELFKQTMSGGGHGGMEMPEEMVYQIYQAQCIKDDTMAESIARCRREMPAHAVVHTNGSFHSDYRQGTVPRLIERRTDTGTGRPDRVVVVAIRPVASFSQASARYEELAAGTIVAADGTASAMPIEVADYIVFVLAPGAGQVALPPSKPAGEEEEEQAQEMPMPPAPGAPQMPPATGGQAAPPAMPPAMPPK